MSEELKLGEIGQIARAVADLARAETWYRDVLGLTHLYTYGTLAFFECVGTRLLLEQSSSITVAGLHNDSILYFRVANIDTAHLQLQARGAKFTQAPQMIFRHPDGMEEWMAFFEDDEGRPLAIMSQTNDR